MCRRVLEEHRGWCYSWVIFPIPIAYPQDFGETDVDCGGPCAPCAAGRGCLYASDCDQTGSSTDGTVYPTGTTMVVCAASSFLCTDLRAGVQVRMGREYTFLGASLLCTDLRAGVQVGMGRDIHSCVLRSRKYLRAGAQAYPDAASQPAAVGLNVSLLGFPPAVFSAAALGSMRSLVAAVLSAHLSPLIQVRTCHACILTSDSDDSDLVSVFLPLARPLTSSVWLWRHLQP